MYSSDELHALGWLKPSERVWTNQENSSSTDIDFDAMDWHLTAAHPFLLEKGIQDAIYDSISDCREALKEEGDK